MKKLTAFITDGLDFLVNIKRSPLERTWMDDTPSKFIYRCLPINIANQYGWQILNTTDFTATWYGDNDPKSLVIESDDTNNMIVSHFGSGIITFKIPIVFRTEKGYDLFVTGPINSIKDSIQPLTGIVETDWNPTTFTMNWKFTRAYNSVSFKAGESICHIFPIKRNDIEEFNPLLSHIESNKELYDEYKFWRDDRNNFNKKLMERDDETVKRGWQRLYFHGKTPRGRVQDGLTHKTKVKLKDFTW